MKLNTFCDVVIDKLLYNDGNIIHILATHKQTQILITLQQRVKTHECVQSLIKTQECVQSLIKTLSLTLYFQNNSEYTYYNATSSDSNNEYSVEIITNPSDKQITRCTHKIPYLIYETPTLYKTETLPTIRKVLNHNKSTKWLRDIVDGISEHERILYRDQHPQNGFVLTIDTKWKTPPPLRSEILNKCLHGHKSVQTLYCLAIINRKDIYTLRDINASHVSLLKNIRKKSLKTIETMYGLHKSQVRAFVHYLPQYYHFHVHFTTLSHITGCLIEHAHLLDDVIQNIELDSSYYEKRTMTMTKFKKK